MAETEEIRGGAGVPRLLRTIETASLAISIVALVVVTLVMTMQVVWRYGLGMPLRWSEAVSVYALVWFFFGAAALAVRDEHVSIPSLTDRMPPALRGWVRIVARAATLAFSIVAFWLGADWVINGFHVQAISLGFSTLWVKIAVPAGFALIGLVTAAHLIGDIAALRRGDHSRFPRAFDGAD